MGGRLQNSALATSQRHPIILSGKDLLTRLIITTKYLALLHAGPTLLMAAANYHIIGARRLIQATCQSCITCRKTSATNDGTTTCIQSHSICSLQPYWNGFCWTFRHQERSH